MKQTIQWKNKSIQIDIGLILILILFCMTSCFALYNSFNLIKFGSGSSYLYRQLFLFIVGFVAMFFLSILQNKKIYSNLLKFTSGCAIMNKHLEINEMAGETMVVAKFCIT